MIERAELRAVGFDVPERGGAQLAGLVTDYRDWLAAAPRLRSPKHYREVESTLRRFLKASGATVAEELTRERAEAWLAGFRGRTYNKHRAHLRAFGRWLLEVRRVVPWHPFSGLAPIAQPVVRRRRVLAAEEEVKLLEATPWIRRVIYRLMLTTGLRLGEVDRLEWRDVGLRVGVVLVRAESSKARREEDLPLTAELVALLEQLLELRRAGIGRPLAPGRQRARPGVANAAADPELLAELRRRHAAGETFAQLSRDLRRRKVLRADGTVWWLARIREAVTAEPREVPPTERIFLGEAGRGTKRTLYRDLARAGIERVTPEGVLDHHSLRHTFSTRLRQRNVHPTTMQRLMRHTDPRLTHGTYQRWNLDELRRAVEG